ncbi:type II toxin-antitoxin system RelE/ParE family toxin [uncultured Mailhella sp.]|uniref:type II toxin-antitoxin system RelE/ParE family toxin n=1 Tax=uncultured Mailhella sp. TaxID=1981031 RepID=UPI00262FF838|nr:type II toxin-antitoxin system RelE/ParE family toxin [uncultured Mailhella sp.]
MNTILTTQLFKVWLAGLRDSKAKVRIARRIERAEQGNFGDHKHVGGAIWEMRIDYGPGYRLYYAGQGNCLYILLCGGDKSAQQEDIRCAQELWEQIHG